MVPFSSACERNKAPILAHLQTTFRTSHTVLEIGSGSGQHALYFGHKLPHLSWITSDLAENLRGIQNQLASSAVTNITAPLLLDVNQHPWPVESVDALFSANTLHIMSWSSVVELFHGIGSVLDDGGVVVIYGPFRYQGHDTSQSNAQFDQMLRQRDPLSGVRDFEAVNQLALEQRLSLTDDFAMPANNRLLVWHKNG